MFIKNLFSRQQPDGIFIPFVMFITGRADASIAFPTTFQAFGTGCIPRPARGHHQQLDRIFIPFVTFALAPVVRLIISPRFKRL
ncbi:MAG: hypothetical protein WCP01_05195 [Methylococcaceae bacterium]